MIPNDREEFAHLIADALAFYGQEISQFGLSVWWQACQPFELVAVRRALGRHAMDPERGMFPPKPADVVRQLQGVPTDRAAKAWSAALDAASRVGSYTDVVFDDPIIHLVITDLGGWPEFCRTPNDRLSYTQHRFTEAYRAYVNRGDVDDWPPKLCGDRSPDETYAARGLSPPRPVLIGDAGRARRVLAEGAGGGRTITPLAALVDETVARIGREGNREDVA